MHFLLQITLFTRNSLLAPKVHFGPEMQFWAQEVILEHKVDFTFLAPETAPSEACFSGAWWKVPKGCHSCTISKQVDIPKKTFPTTHNSERFPQFIQNLHLWHVGLHYSGTGRSVATFAYFRRGGAFWCKNASGIQNRMLGPKMRFGPENALWGPCGPLAADAYE